MLHEGLGKAMLFLQWDLVEAISEEGKDALKFNLNIAP